MNTDIESCAGGVSESLTALQEIQSGASHDVKTAVSIATIGAAELLAGQQHAHGRPRPVPAA